MLARPCAATRIRSPSNAAMAPRGEVKLYSEGHFEIYVDDAFERVTADQIEFLDKNLKA